MGGSYPNHFLYFSNKIDDKFTSIIKDCINGKHVKIDAEVDFYVISFHCLPIRFGPHINLAGFSNNIIENNGFLLGVVRTCNTSDKYKTILFL